jgi:tripartite-type tricarboxylate transporter receptor subunit TctC
LNNFKIFFKNIVYFLLIATTSAHASDYPNRPIKWVVSYSAGGTADIIARLLSQPLGEILRQPVIVENKPGGGNNIGTDFVLKSAPDGYTMLFVNPANGTNATLYKSLSFNFIEDSVPVAGIIRVPNVMVVPANFPANTVPEFLAYCKQNNTKINMASSGVGSSVHLAGELFKSMSGCDMSHVPYKGAAPAMTDLLAGHVQVMFDNLPSAAQHIKSGKLKALAVTSSSRESTLPTVPTLNEFIPGYEITAWYGISMPKGTPKDVITKMNRAVNKALEDPKVRERLSDVGAIFIPGTPDNFGKTVILETQKLGKIVKAVGITID